MDVLEIGGAEVEALAAHLPANVVANDEKVAKATGILERRVASPDETALDLSLRAAERLFEEGAARPDDFGAVVSVSFTQHDRMPCGACQAQSRLGLPKNVIAFDVMQACAGYGHGLYLAALLARQTGGKTLLLDGDKQSEFMDPNDAATSPLLGDAGTATVVAPSAAAPAWKFAFASDGGKGGALRLERGGTIKMDGFGVFRFVATDVVAMLKEFMSSVGEGAADESFLFAPHQANVYMVRQLAKSAGIAEDRLLVSADRYGNLSSASIPVTLAAHGERIRGGKVLLAGFGGGLSAAFGMVDVRSGCAIVLNDGIGGGAR